MSDVVNFDLTGFDELEKQLAELDLVAQKKVLRKTAAAAAEPIRAQMLTNYRQQWDSDSGQLDESIKTRVTIPRNPNFADVVASVGVFRVRAIEKLSGHYLPAPVYAYWLEHGVREHSLGKGASLKQYSTGKKRRERSRIERPDQSTGLIHPGFAGRPFIRPAFDNHMEKALEIEKQTLSDEIDKALSR